MIFFYGRLNATIVLRDELGTSSTMIALYMSKSDGTIERAIVDILGVGKIIFEIHLLVLAELWVENFTEITWF